MEKIVAELKQIIEFKDTTEVGDVILIASKEPQMLIYAYVLNIVKDTTRKDEWWNLQFKILSIPLQKMTWTLRTPQMTGQEIFTMGGDKRFIQAVDLEGVSPEQATDDGEGHKGRKRPNLQVVK